MVIRIVGALMLVLGPGAVLITPEPASALPGRRTIRLVKPCPPDPTHTPSVSFLLLSLKREEHYRSISSTPATGPPTGRLRGKIGCAGSGKRCDPYLYFAVPEGPGNAAVSAVCREQQLSSDSKGLALEKKLFRCSRPLMGNRKNRKYDHLRPCGIDGLVDRVGRLPV